MTAGRSRTRGSHFADLREGLIRRPDRRAGPLGLGLMGVAAATGLMALTSHLLELRHDLRAALMKHHWDWDLSNPDVRAPWERGERDRLASARPGDHVKP